MGEASGGREGEAEGGKGELLVKGEVSVEGGGNWEEREGGEARGLLKAEGEGTGGRVVETEREPMEMVLVPGKDRRKDRPETIITKVIP